MANGIGVPGASSKRLFGMGDAASAIIPAINNPRGADGSLAKALAVLLPLPTSFTIVASRVVSSTLLTLQLWQPTRWAM